MCKKVIACFLLVTLQCSPVSSLEISRTSVQHHETANGRELTRTSVQRHEDEDGNVVQVVHRSVQISSGTLGGADSSEGEEGIPVSLVVDLSPTPAPEVPRKGISPLVPPVVPKKSASSLAPETEESSSPSVPVLPFSGLEKETTSSGKATTTFAPAIPRIPHFTTGSFIIGFFLAILIVGVVFAAVRMFLKRRAEPRPYTVY